VWICVEPKPKSHKNIVIVNPGLTNGARSRCCRDFCYYLNKAGFQTVVIVRRGIETNTLKTTLFFKYNLIDDYEVVMKYLDSRFDNPNYYSIGISMGANLLCRTTQLNGKRSRIKA